MMSARRLKRNFRRAMIPLETILLWVMGPLAALLYWLSHWLFYSLPVGRAINFLLTRLR